MEKSTIPTLNLKSRNPNHFLTTTNCLKILVHMDKC